MRQCFAFEDIKLVMSLVFYHKLQEQTPKSILSRIPRLLIPYKDEDRCIKVETAQTMGYFGGRVWTDF
ncbi:unnamed protein product [Rhizopus microsporus]